MEYREVKEAIERGGSINKAAKLLNKSPQTISLWLAKNGLEISATIRPVQKKSEQE